MKKIVLSLTALLFLSLSQAQVLQFTPESKQFQSLITRTINVVETGNEEFDKALHSAFDTYWKSTKFEYISYDEFKKSVTDQSKSFFIPMNINVTFTKLKGMQQQAMYEKTKFWYGLINGGKKSIESYGDNDVIVLSPIGLYSGEDQLFPSMYRLDYVVKSMDDAITAAKDGQIKGKLFESLKPINAGFVKIAKEKTLIINQDAHSIAMGKDRGQTTTTKAFAEYPYKYKFVSDSEFKEIMAGNDESYICLLPVIEVNKHVMVFEPSTKKTVYYGWQMQGLEVKAGDVKSMAKGEF
jgi:hypothetical protein